MKKILVKLCGVLVSGTLMSCGNPPLPKPEGYLRLDFPEKAYRAFDSLPYPYRFEYPVYAGLAPDKDSRSDEPYWLNIKLPLNATLHISYKQVKNNLSDLIDDTYKFAYRHVIKADAIAETTIRDDERHIQAVLYEIEGDAASSVQFYATDSVRHFIRGALYFMETPNYAYLLPAITYYTADITHLIETLQWK
jgi:gliding motility-associated lipoprotein GldD